MAIRTNGPRLAVGLALALGALPNTATFAQYGGGFSGGGPIGSFGSSAAPDLAPLAPAEFVTVRVAEQPGAADTYFAPLSKAPAALAALAKPARLHFEDQPLEVITAFMSEDLGVMIDLEVIGLEDAALTSDVEVTFHSDSLNYAQALDLMLRDLQLDYLVKENHLVLTSCVLAEEEMETRLYAIVDHPLLHGADVERFTRTIQEQVNPENWPAVGGTGNGAINVLPGALVVTNDRRTLERVEDFLEQYGRLLASYDRAYSPPTSVDAVKPSDSTAEKAAGPTSP